MATQLVKKLRVEKLQELYLTRTENQLLELYQSGEFYELCGLKNKRIDIKTFGRDMETMIQEMARSRQNSMTPEQYEAKIEKWKRRLELEITIAKSQRQIGVISAFLFKLMALDGVTTDSVRPGGGDVYIFQNNTFVASQPDKIKDVEIELAERQEANDDSNN